MKNDIPKAGDRAMILQTHGTPELVGQIVSVLSDSHLDRAEIIAGINAGKFITAIVNDVILPEPPKFHKNRRWAIPTNWLLRIPPDDECENLFGTNEQPVSV